MSPSSLAAFTPRAALFGGAFFLFGGALQFKLNFKCTPKILGLEFQELFTTRLNVICNFIQSIETTISCGLAQILLNVSTLTTPRWIAKLLLQIVLPFSYALSLPPRLDASTSVAWQDIAASFETASTLHSQMQPLHRSITVSTRNNMSRLDDLPPEILRRICEYALPQGLTFSFEETHPAWGGDRLVWIVWAARRLHERVIVVGERFVRPDRRQRSQRTVP